MQMQSQDPPQLISHQSFFGQKILRFSDLKTIYNNFEKHDQKKKSR